jgi:hypothetical protein
MTGAAVSIDVTGFTPVTAFSLMATFDPLRTLANSVLYLGEYLR